MCERSLNCRLSVINKISYVNRDIAVEPTLKRAAHPVIFHSKKRTLMIA